MEHREKGRPYTLRNQGKHQILQLRRALTMLQLTKLDRLLAHKAIYDADLGDGATVTREACTAGTREEILKDIIAWADDI